MNLRWHHLCFTYDAEQHLLSTYIDGHLNSNQDVDFHDKYISADRAVLGQGVDHMRSFSGNLTQVTHLETSLSQVIVFHITFISNVIIKYCLLCRY